MKRGYRGGSLKVPSFSALDTKLANGFASMEPAISFSRALR
jgi:hypothetical protein